MRFWNRIRTILHQCSTVFVLSVTRNLTNIEMRTLVHSWMHGIIIFYLLWMSLFMRHWLLFQSRLWDHHRLSNSTNRVTIIGEFTSIKFRRSCWAVSSSSISFKEILIQRVNALLSHLLLGLFPIFKFAGCSSCPQCCHIQYAAWSRMG